MKAVRFTLHGLFNEREHMREFAIILILLCTVMAEAYTVPAYRDIKPATQAMLERQDFGTPAAASATAVKASFAGATSAATITYNTFNAQPDVPRNLSITPGGTTGDVEACTIVVNGTNIKGKAISENFVFLADASTATVGSKAFKTVTSVVFPANCESGSFAATWTIGYGEKLGIKACMANAGDWAWSHVAGVYESTRATVVNSASAVESNTADFNGTMNGTSRFIGFFVQNFACN